MTPILEHMIDEAVLFPQPDDVVAHRRAPGQIRRLLGLRRAGEALERAGALRAAAVLAR